MDNGKETKYDCIYEKQFEIATPGRFVRHITLQHKRTLTTPNSYFAKCNTF